MKHTSKSASPGELACPHLSDHPTQEAKQHSNSNHGRSVPIFPVPLRDLFGHSGSELRGDQKTPVIPQIPHFRSNPSARSADSPVRRLSPFHRILNVTVSLCHKVTTAKNTFQTRRNTRKNTRRNTLKLPKNTQNTEKNTFFFLSAEMLTSDPPVPLFRIKVPFNSREGPYSSLSHSPVNIFRLYKHLISPGLADLCR